MLVIRLYSRVGSREVFGVVFFGEVVEIKIVERLILYFGLTRVLPLFIGAVVKVGFTLHTMLNRQLTNIFNIIAKILKSHDSVLSKNSPGLWPGDSRGVTIGGFGIRCL